MTNQNSILVNRVQKIYKKICIVPAVIAAITIAIMMLSTVLDATSRYLLNRPLPGVFELNEVILVVCVYMSIAWTQMERGHIRVTAFILRFSEKNKAKLNMVSWFITFLFVFIVGIESFIAAKESFLAREFRWGSVQMPIWWAKMLVPIGLSMLGIQLLIDIWKEIEFIKGRIEKPND